MLVKTVNLEYVLACRPTATWHSSVRKFAFNRLLPVDNLQLPPRLRNLRNPVWGTLWYFFTDEMNAGRGQESRTDRLRDCVGVGLISAGAGLVSSPAQGFSSYAIFHTLEWGKMQTCQTHMEKRLPKFVMRNTATWADITDQQGYYLLGRGNDRKL